MIKYNSMLKQMIALTALMVSSIAFAQDREYVIVVHGGAGAMAGLEEDPVKSAQYYAALDSALMIVRWRELLSWTLPSWKARI